VVSASCGHELEAKVREVERLLGRKTMETEIFWVALDVTWGKSLTGAAITASGRFSVKAVPDFLGVARSNLIEQLKDSGHRRGPYGCEGDDALLAELSRRHRCVTYR
jgi:hypothetical protein